MEEIQFNLRLEIFRICMGKCCAEQNFVNEIPMNIVYEIFI